MEITITVPELKCSRCDATAPIRPHLLYVNDQVVPPHLREVFSHVLKTPLDTIAIDDNDNSWAVVTDERPVGWSKGPNASELCEECATLWAETNKAFMVPPPVVVLEPVVEPIVVVDENGEVIEPLDSTTPPIEDEHHVDTAIRYQASRSVTRRDARSRRRQ